MKEVKKFREIQMDMLLLENKSKKKDGIYNVNFSKVYNVVTSWMKTHPKDMEILGR